VVCDDSAAMRHLLRTMLGTVEGIEVVGEAADGEEAVDVVQRERPDLVVMDEDMPKRAGTEAVEVLRARGFAGQVVVFTGVSGVAPPPGVDHVIRKDALSELVALLQR
jgi:DNA-binding NarL/FixJ family response regulator